MFELIIDNLKPEHNETFIYQIMSTHGDIEDLKLINNDKTAILTYSYVRKKMRQLYDSLNVLESISFYYDDESNESWDMSKVEKEHTKLIEEIVSLQKSNQLYQYKLYEKDEKIQELEAMLKQLKDEHYTAMIMLKDMNKLLK